jgi:DNA-binding HxlR family transcriptional regulator
MEEKQGNGSQCPIARSLARVGEWWSILILRDALYGMTRFDDFQKSLGIAPNMLTRRLKGLVEAGLFERRQYCDRPTRYEYVLTEMGNDFRPVIWSLLAWGNKYFAPEGASVLLANKKTGRITSPVLIDEITGERLRPESHGAVPGPAADEYTRGRFSKRERRLS